MPPYLSFLWLTFPKGFPQCHLTFPFYGLPFQEDFHNVTLPFLSMAYLSKRISTMSHHLSFLWLTFPPDFHHVIEEEMIDTRYVILLSDKDVMYSQINFHNVVF